MKDLFASFAYLDIPPACKTKPFKFCRNEADVVLMLYFIAHQYKSQAKIAKTYLKLPLLELALKSGS